MFKNIFPFMLATLLFLTTGCSTASNPEAEAAALESAKSWLALVDAEKYENSWNESAEVLQNAISSVILQTSIEKARKPFGAVISREVKSTKYRTSLPGLPEGQYVVILFTTSFQNQKSVIETVVPMVDKDGKWRVSGYYIK
jgi:hypothetical protein